MRDLVSRGSSRRSCPRRRSRDWRQTGPPPVHQVSGWLFLRLNPSRSVGPSRDEHSKGTRSVEERADYRPTCKSYAQGQACFLSYPSRGEASLFTRIEAPAVLTIAHGSLRFHWANEQAIEIEAGNKFRFQRNYIPNFQGSFVSVSGKEARRTMAGPASGEIQR